MLKAIRNLMTTALVVLASSAIAQEASTTDQGLSLGEPALPEIKREVIGDWSLNCQIQGEREVCEIFQLLVQPDGKPAIAVTLFPLSNQGEAIAGGTFISPLETLLTAQLTIAVDANLPRRYPFAYCTVEGCYSRIGLTQADVDSYKAGTKATISVLPAAAPDQPVQVEMSLDGFTAAFEKAQSKMLP